MIIRNCRIVSVLALASSLLAPQAFSQQPPAPAAAPSPAERAAMERQREELNRRPDTPGTGAYPAMKEEIPALTRHVIYRPTNIAAMGAKKLGVIAWGNGGCSDDAASTRFHLLELASHGNLVIAAGRILSGPGAPPPAPRAAPPPGQLPPPRTDATDLNAAIDWALAENKRAGSSYFGRIDPEQVAVAGFSCGGLQALQAAKDPRVTAVILQNTGVFNGASARPSMNIGSSLKPCTPPALHPRRSRNCLCQRMAYSSRSPTSRRVANLPVVTAAYNERTLPRRMLPLTAQLSVAQMQGTNRLWAPNAPLTTKWPERNNLNDRRNPNAL